MKSLVHTRFSKSFQSVGAALVLPALAVGAQDAVVRWNHVLQTTIRVDNTSPGPTWASRNPALMHVAMYEAVNSINRSYQPFYEYVPASPGASMEAAVAQAAFRVLVDLYPAQISSLSVDLAGSLRGLPEAGRDAGVAVGDAAAALVLARRSGDGSASPSTYSLNPAPGHWRPDPLHPTQTPLGANWGGVKPFVLESSHQFRAPVPPALNSPAYLASYNEVRRLGAVDSRERTMEQTEIGMFWGYDRGGLGPPMMLYFQVGELISQQRQFSLEDNARLFAMLAVAQADAGIACWESKYYYDFWRPVTGIREGETDTNPSTAGDVSWVPLGAPAGGPPRDFTPPFPAYPSGHATFGAAIFRILELVCGQDDVAFTITSEEVPAAPRAFKRFSDASLENGRSRIYLGVHWDFDDTEGRVMGRKVADQVFTRRFAPVLRFTRTGATFQTAWPANIRSFRLESCPVLGPNSWLPEIAQPTVAGAVQSISFPAELSRFFRLAPMGQ